MAMLHTVSPSAPTMHLVTAANAALYQSQLEAMHRLRWAVFVEDRGWAALRAMQAEPGLERDQYDDARAHYLIAIGEAGDVQGAMRVRPADDRALLTDHFLHLVEAPERMALSPNVWELTRLVRAPMSRAQDGVARYAMNCALIEFCLSRRIERLLAASETFLLPMTRKAWGDKVRPIGLPQPYDEGEVIAVELIPDAEALCAMRAAGSVERPQLYEHASAWSGGRDPLASAKAAQALWRLPSAALGLAHAHIAALALEAV